MRRNGLAGLPGRPRYRKVPNQPTASDLVDRQFARDGPDQLRVTDITEHPTREGKVYCAVVLDTFSRRVVGWAIDSRPHATLATNTLAMAIENRQPAGSIIHSGQLTSWAFTQRALDSGLSQSMGSIEDCFDNAVIESFWARMQVELLNRRRWRTRIELSNAIFEYLEIFHNRQRRRSSLGMLTPVEYEIRHATTTARSQANRPREPRGTPLAGQLWRISLVGVKGTLLELLGEWSQVRTMQVAEHLRPPCPGCFLPRPEIVYRVSQGVTDSWKCQRSRAS